MSEAQNTALARRWFQQVWNEGRAETVHELLAPDAVGHLDRGGAADPARRCRCSRAARPRDVGSRTRRWAR